MKWRGITFAWLVLTAAACTGLGDFPTPSCDRSQKLQRVDMPADSAALSVQEIPSGMGFVLGTGAGEPRALAQLSRAGVWEQRALDPRTLCADVPAATGCRLTGLDLAPLGDGYVLALGAQLSAADCGRLRLALTERLSEPVLSGGDAPGSLYAGVHLDAEGCTRGGARDPRLAALGGEPTRDVLLTWRSDEPVTDDPRCPAGTGSYVAALGVSVPADGYGLFSEERESLHCLGRSNAAPSVVAAARADAYFVGLLEPAALRIVLVPSYAAQAAGARVREGASLPLTAADADRLALGLSADQQLLTARWTEAGRVHLAVFDLAQEGGLRLRTRADAPALGPVTAAVQLLRVEQGLLDWRSHEVDAGWIIWWLTGQGSAAQLRASRVSDRTGKPLGDPLEVARGALTLPIVSHGVSGDVYGFVIHDETGVSSDVADLALYSVECVVAARP